MGNVYNEEYMEFDTFMITMSDGKEQECAIVDEFDFEGKHYMLGIKEILKTHSPHRYWNNQYLLSLSYFLGLIYLQPQIVGLLLDSFLNHFQVLLRKSSFLFW